MSLRAVNLNLVPVLRALLRHSSVVGAAREVGLSESATSTCLGQLRARLGDRLLVKVGRGMRLTPYAAGLLPDVEQVCAALNSLFQPATFEPEHSKRTFVVATPDYIVVLLGPPLMAVLAKLAPGVSVQFVDVPEDLPRRVSNGEIDIAIVAVDKLTWTGFNATAPVVDDLVVIVGRGHPLASRKTLDAKDAGQWRRATFHPGLGVDPVQFGDGRFSQLLSQQFTVLPLLALETDIAVIAPRSLATRMAQRLPLRVFELPYAAPPIRASVIWSPVVDSDLAHTWFRNLADRALRTGMAASGKTLVAQRTTEGF